MTSWRPRALLLLLAAWACTAHGSLLEQAREAENRHDFYTADTLLRELVQTDPRHGGAWIRLASLATVRGDLQMAERACSAAAPHVDVLLTLACRGRIGLATGEYQRAYVALSAVLEHPAYRSRRDSQYIWAVGVAAELAAAVGERAAADRRFRLALAHGAPSSLRGAWLDFLLEEGRYAEVLQAVGASEHDVALAVRRIIALMKVELRWQATAEIAALDRVFRDWLQYGDYTHGREMARFYLDVYPDAQLAAQAAVQNFRQQRESEDRELRYRALAQVAPQREGTGNSARQPGDD